MHYKQFRNILISLFVVIWTVVFHYESLRFFYLNKLFQKPLPKVKLLFPPAGWIMFYNIADGFGYVEVYGQKGQDIQLIDPHDIFRTKTIGFDNIHRNVLSSVADKAVGPSFCRFLRYRFPYYEKFHVTSVYYPSVVREPWKRYQQVQYICTY